MFELKIASQDASSGAIPISWCVDHETLKVLSDNNVEDPQVIIVVSPVNSYHPAKEVRKMIPMQDLMTYIDFRASGPNKIWGFVSLRKKKDARDRYLLRENGEYRTDVLNMDGTDWSGPFTVEYSDDNAILNAPYLSVDVPAGCFAKEPWEWEKTWVNHFFRGKCADQCEFRRRRMFAYTVQPVLMVFNIIIRFLLLTLAGLLAARNITLNPLFHPLRYSLGDAWNGCCGGSYAIRHLPEDEKNHWEPDNVTETFSYIFRSFWPTVSMPLISIPLLLLAWLHHWTILTIVGLVVLAALLIIFVVAVFMTESGSNWMRALKGKPKKEKPVKEEEEDEESQLWYMNREEMDMLVCNAERKPLTLASLPAKKRTMRLRFLDLKSKVCRPFSV